MPTLQSFVVTDVKESLMLSFPETNTATCDISFQKDQNFGANQCPQRKTGGIKLEDI